MLFNKLFSSNKAKNHLEKWGVRVSAILTFLMGGINLISAVQPALRNRFLTLETFIPLEVSHGGRITSALAGFALLLLASNLWRRKRVAWILTLLLLAISILTHLVKGLDFEDASVSLIILIFLALLRNSFHAESDRPSIKQGLYTLAAALAFTIVYGAIGFYLLDRHFNTQFGLSEAIRQSVVMFTSFYNPGLQAITGFGRYFAGSIYVIGLGTLSFAIIMLIRPVLVRRSSTVEERTRAEQIVQQHGRTSLSRATLFEDKSYFFDPAETVIAYAVSGRGVVALGDPIGPPAQAAAAITGFKNFCGHNDWTPAFVSTLPDYLEQYKAAGFDAVCLGYEAIVSLENFSLEGSKNKDTRNAVSRVERAGYRFEVHLPPLDDSLIRSLHEVSDSWLTLRHGGEMHFSDGWFEDNYIRNAPVAVIYTSDGTPIAFANLVSEYQKNEVTIDLMRHYPKVEHGTMEFLFVSMFQWAKDQGYGSFSLGLSAIVGVGEKPDDPKVEQALHTISEYVSRFYNFKGLHTFKEKFSPQWEPRYLVYPDPSSLPLILSTILKVHSGNHYLSRFLRD